MLVGRKAPNFKATAVVKGEFKNVQLSDYQGKHVVLFFYPLDFTFVCPTEIVAFQDRLGEFKERGVEVLGVSVDSQFSHKAWLETPRNKGGIEGVEYPLVADVGGHIARAYGVLSGKDAGSEEADSYTPGNVSYRGTFLIDKKGVVRTQVVTDEPVGRSVDETLRQVDALQFAETHGGEVCPAEWRKGQKGMKTTTAGVADHLTSK